MDQVFLVYSVVMHQNPHLSSLMVLVPAFNEEQTVAQTVATAFSTLKPQAVVVVDDGSQDQTAAAAEQAGAIVLRLAHNLGVGGALRTGYRFAKQQNFTRVIQLDADGQHRAEYAHVLLSRLDKADIVIGSRFAPSSDFSQSSAYRTSWVRRVGMKSLARSVSKTVGHQLTDVTSGFRALGPRAIHVFAQAFPMSYLGDTVTSTIIAHHAGLTIREEPTPMLPRQGGQATESVVSAAVLFAQAHISLATAAGRHTGRSLAKPGPAPWHTSGAHLG